MPTGCPTSARDAVETYKTSKVEGATPGQLVLEVYDYIIACCRRGDGMRAKKGLVELMGSLNLDSPDISGPLFRTYEYCLDIVREKKFEEAVGVLTEIREAWAAAVDRVESGAGTSSEETPAR